MNPKTMMASAAMAASIFATAPAFAEQPMLTAEAVHNTETAASAQPDAVPVAAPVMAEAKRPSPILSNDELNEQRGGQTLVVANQTLTAVTQGNVLNGDFVAGNVSLTDSALSNFNGVGNIVINTGAQVSLASGMNLTINLGE